MEGSSCLPQAVGFSEGFGAQPGRVQGADFGKMLFQNVIGRDSRMEGVWLSVVVTVQERGEFSSFFSCEKPKRSHQNCFRVYDLSEVSLGMKDTNVLRQRSCKLQGPNW